MQRWDAEFRRLLTEFRSHDNGKYAICLELTASTSDVVIDMLRAALGDTYTLAEERLIDEQASGAFATMHRHLFVSRRLE